MSLDIIKSVFQEISMGTNWSLQLLNIKTSKRTGTGYSSRQITLIPNDRLDTLIKDIASVYTGNGKKSVATYHTVREYDGTADAFTVYKLSSTHELISEEYTAFVQVIANPNNEDDPFEYTSAYLLKGQLEVNSKSVPIKRRLQQSICYHIYYRYSHLISQYGMKWCYSLFSFWFWHSYLYATTIFR